MTIRETAEQIAAKWDGRDGPLAKQIEAALRAERERASGEAQICLHCENPAHGHASNETVGYVPQRKTIRETAEGIVKECTVTRHEGHGGLPFFTANDGMMILAIERALRARDERAVQIAERMAKTFAEHAEGNDDEEAVERFEARSAAALAVADMIRDTADASAIREGEN